MKKITLIFLFLVFTGVQLYPASLTTISGKWDRDQENTVSLFRIISGRLEPLSTYVMQEDNRFAFAFPQEKEGFYVLGNASPQMPVNKYIFYFKPGDQLNVEINDSTYTLQGTNTPENKVMEQWHNHVLPLEWMAVYLHGKVIKGDITYVDFFPKLEGISKQGFKPVVKGSVQFERMFTKFREFDLMNYAFHFLMTPRTAHPQGEDFTDFYHSINIPELTKTEDLFDYPYGMRLMTSLLYWVPRIKNNTPSDKLEALTLEQKLELIGSDALKGEIVLQSALPLKTYAGYVDLMDQYGKYISSADQKQRAQKIKIRLAEQQTTVGTERKQAPNFTATDVNGKNVSLSDFKGKVVVVDVWATWCGPCKRELPHLKKITQDYQGKNVVFIGVSVDEPKDLEKWKQFIKDEKLTGVQIFAGGFKSEVAQLYKIQTIPRFMVFDQRGNIVSTDAPRPSSNELRIMLDELLSEK